MTAANSSGKTADMLNALFCEQIRRIRTFLQSTGKTPQPKNKPRVFVAVHHVNWEKHGMVDAWADIADIIHYDWGDLYDQFTPDWHTKGKLSFNAELLQRVTAAHQKQPLDLFFSYLSGRWIFPTTIPQINQLGIITINIGFDDKIKFYGFREQTGFSGNAEIAPGYDLNITCQTASDVQQFTSVGARSIFLPPGGNPSAFSPSEMEKDIPVSFIGQCYGVRPRLIEWMQNQGIPIQTFGKGWPSGEIPLEKMKEIYSRSLINLGFGFIGDSLQLTGLKGRDFEVPLTGNLYLTTYNQELETCLRPGHEMDCYCNPNECFNKIRYYIANPSLAAAIGRAGRERCLREHTWTQRFRDILAILGFSRGKIVYLQDCQKKENNQP